jgi:hypothetical protein
LMRQQQRLNPQLLLFENTPPEGRQTGCVGGMK